MNGTIPRDRRLRLGNIGLVFLGGTVGTLARFGLGEAIGSVAELPVGIFVINISGAFALGLLMELLARSGGGIERLRLLLGVGLLGGYTTYSLLAFDVAALMLDGRALEALGYAAATLLVGGLATWAGVLLGASRKGRT